MQNIKPLKRFGQNYLQDKNILRKIAEEINPAENELLIEIGPGKGALTNELVNYPAKIIAVEVDTRVIEELKNKFPGVKFIQKDFLELDLFELSGLEQNELRIVGNIPYNLTSSILFKLIEEREVVKDSVLMVQYEVGKRMTAKKGTKDYGILSVLLNYFFKVNLRFKVSPSAFYPKPNVDSAVMHLYKKDIQMEEEEVKSLIKIVKAAFGNRRKTLKNSLSNSIFTKLDFSGSGIDLSLRAEQLDSEDFLKLTKFARNELDSR